MRTATCWLPSRARSRSSGRLHDLSFSPIGNTLIPYLNGFNDPPRWRARPMTRTWWWSRPASTASFGLINGGGSWTPAATAGAIGFSNSRMVFPTSTRVYLASPSSFQPGGLYRSDDAGRSFARLSSLPFGRDCRRCGQFPACSTWAPTAAFMPFQVDRRRADAAKLGQPGLLQRDRRRQSQFSR